MLGVATRPRLPHPALCLADKAPTRVACALASRRQQLGLWAVGAGHAEPISTAAPCALQTCGIEWDDRAQ